jgi:hypothetical protein
MGLHPRHHPHRTTACGGEPQAATPSRAKTRPRRPDLVGDLRLCRSCSGSTYLDGAYGGVKSREAVDEGAKDGDDGIGDLLALVKGLTQQRHALCEGHQAPGWFNPPPVESMFTCGG